MVRKRETKAQSLVIGFMLILALSIALFAWFQVTQLPEINREAEIDYEEDVEIDMTDLNQGIWSITESQQNEVYPTLIRTTVDYPLQNTKTDASTAQISFETINTSAYSFSNSDPVSVVGDITATRIEHSPTLFVRSPSDTIIENNVVVRNTSEGIIQPVSSQLLISENKIYLSQVNTFSDSIVKENPEIVLREASRQSTTMQAQDTSNPIIMEAKTTLTEDFWRDQFEEVSAVDEDNVVVSDGTLEIPLDGSRTYEVYVSRMNLESE
jgi:hypothetical protein